MGNSEKHIVRFWRGTRESYNILKDGNYLDYWTRYSVKEPSGAWTEYYGDNQISSVSGQLLPVKKRVKTLPGVLNNGDRYLVGHDTDSTGPAEYYIVEVGVSEKPGTQGNLIQNTVIKPFDDRYSVRIKDEGLMTFQLVDGKLITYDEVDCGTY